MLDIARMIAEVSGDQDLDALSKVAHQPEQPGPNAGAGIEGEIGKQMGSTAMDARAILHEKALQQAGDQLDMTQWDDSRENLNTTVLQPPGSMRPAPLDAGRGERELKTHLPKTAGIKEVARGVRDAAARAGLKGRQAVEGVSRKFHGTRAGAAYRRVAQKGREAAGAARNVAATRGADAMRAGRAKLTEFGMKHRGKMVAGAAGAAGAAVGAAGGYAAGRRKEASFADYVDLILSGDDGVKTASESFSPAEIAGLDAQVQSSLFMGRAMALGMMKQAHLSKSAQ